MRYLLSQLVKIDELQSLCERFTRLTGFATAILDMEGNVLVASGWQEVCTRFHRLAPETSLKCRESDTVLSTLLGKGDKYSLYRCRNGLIDAAVPIFIGDTRVGSLYTGQFLFEPPDLDFFQRQAVLYGFDEESYLAAVKKVPIVTEEQVRRAMDFLCEFAGMVGGMGLANRNLAQANEELLEHKEHLERLVEERTAELTLRNEELRLDIVERRRVEEALRISEFCIENAAMSIFRIGSDAKVLYANEQACRSLGYCREELCAMSVYDFDPCFTPSGWAEHRRKVYAEGSRTIETCHRRKDGTVFPVEVTVNYLEYQGTKFSFSFAKDISERKQAEEKIRTSLQEKDVLLKEIHHRVKNNLLVVSNLLDLQSEHIADDRMRRFFQESQDRIQSMALIHEKLYQKRDYRCIDFLDYLDTLSHYLLHCYEKKPGLISLNVEADTVTVGIDEAIPLGLIVNELLSNALKYAFPQGRQGTITIRCLARDDGRISLIVADDGVGLPAGLDFRNTETLGLQLVTLLVRQLRGILEIENDGGASFAITFSPTAISTD
ncbi:MAG TPA: PocR ligand-binding domain-containing protein [Geobacteraceae bacterium]|nr:PocR ligand-binding domain-containing protein [Geobacteraceae bacterium]